MTGFAIAVAGVAWASLWLKPRRTVTALLAVLFLLLGFAFAYIGCKGLMAQASWQSGVLLSCGVVTVVSRAGMAIRALFGEDD